MKNKMSEIKDKIFQKQKRKKRVLKLSAGPYKALYILTVLVALCALIYQGYDILTKIKSASASDVIDWGVSFREKGTTPIGNADNDYLLSFSSCYHADETNKSVYLTFDAGYENGYTPAILDILKDNEVPAAFFLTGHFLKNEGDLVKRMANEGHIVGNHTMNHPDMTILDENEFASQINEAAEIYTQCTCEEMPMYFRPPAGKFNELTLKRAQNMGYKTILWSIAYNDWDNNAQPNCENAIETLCSRTHPGAIILLHATSKTNSLILDEYIKTLKSQGYEFLSLDELKWE